MAVPMTPDPKIAAPNHDPILAGIDDGIVLEDNVGAGGKSHGAVKGIDDDVRSAISIRHRAHPLAVAAVADHHGLLLLAITIAAATQDRVSRHGGG